MKLLLKSLLAALSIAAFSASAERLYDVQFELNGYTYTLYNQTFPIELIIGYCGSDSLDDILYTLLQDSNPCFGRITSQPWVGGLDIDSSIASISDSDPSMGTYTLTLSQPFTGAVEVNGTYEGDSWQEVYDETTGEYVPMCITEEGYFTVNITVPGYVPPADINGIPARECDIGKVIGTDGRVYESLSDAISAGTPGEAMIAHIDISSGTGLAIALTDVSESPTRRYDIAVLNASDWSMNHWMTFGEWRIPSVADWKRIFAAFGGTDYATEVVANVTYDTGYFRNSLTTVGGTDVDVKANGWYFTSDTIPNNKIWCYDFSSSSFFTNNQIRASAYTRMCLAFDLDFIYGYRTWSEENSFTGAWDAKDPSGVYNVFRYAFNVPTGDFPAPLLSVSFNAENSVVIKTPELVNTDGFDFSIIASDDIAGTENAESYPLSPDGTTVIEYTGKPSRFFRLKVKVAQPSSNY